MDSKSNASGNITAGIGGLLADGARRLGHAPLMTFYDDATGEQTELSYATFSNWVSKTANLLTEEMDAGRGARVLLRAHDHWTAAVIAAAVWKVGAVLVLGHDRPASAGEVLVVAEEAAAAAGHDRLLVVGAGIGGRVMGNPPGVHFGDEVLAFGDDYDDPAVSVDDAAVDHHGTRSTSAELLRDATALLPPGGRALSTASLATRQGLVEVLVAPIFAAGSVVWCPAASGADLDARAAQERVTHRFGGGSAASP